jgi:hypothetical protein
MAGHAHSPRRRLCAALCILLGLGAGSASAQPEAAGDFDRFASASFLPEPTLSVRQGGGGDDKGLLNRMRGPAAMLDFGDPRREGFRSLAGATDGPNGRHGYVAGVGRGSLLGVATTLNYAADELGGSAVEGRVRETVAGVKLTLSQTFNNGFESQWTGQGDRRALRMTEAGADWSAFDVLPVGLALRRTRHADGSESEEFRTVQTLMVGDGMVVNSTATDLAFAGPDETSGNLLYYGPVGPVQLTAGVDYGGYHGKRPGVLRLGLEKNFEQGWSLYAYAEHPLHSEFSRADIGASRDFGGFLFTAFAGGAQDGTAYTGLRVTLPLMPVSRRDSWLGL